MDLLPFQNRFIRAVENPRYDTVALTGPRGLGKTFLAGHILARAMTPGDVLHQPGKEFILGAASLEQARMTYAYVRAALEPLGGYRWIDSTTRLGATHIASNTKLRAISSNAKTSFGLVGVPIVVIDEPGALEIVGGQMLADSLMTAQGKVGSSLQLILIGTLAPMATGPGHWWYDLVNKGTVGKTYVDAFRGDPDRWDEWNHVKAVNPLTKISKEFRAKLRAEMDAAHGDSRLRARWLSYRLNSPAGDESTMLLTVDDWQQVLQRPVAERVGKPIVGVDLGAGRAFSAAVAVWRSGRVEAIALAPGIPELGDQEKRDRQPSGTYQALVDSGTLRIAQGLRVQPPRQLIDAIVESWGTPATIVCDRFRLKDLEDASKGIPIEARVTQWSEASFDIRALRRFCKDGPFSCEIVSRGLVASGLSVAMVKNDDAGNSRLIKSKNNTARDDVPAAWLLAAGAFDRALSKPKRGALFRGAV